MIPRVVASESGAAQTGQLVDRGCRTPARLQEAKWKRLGNRTGEGESPVHTVEGKQEDPEYHGAR